MAANANSQPSGATSGIADAREVRESVGIYVSEVQRLGRDAAWASTKAALRAVGLSMLIELTSTLLAAATWIIGVTIT